MNALDYEHIWKKLYEWRTSRLLSFKLIRRLVPQLDMEQAAHKQIIEFVAKVAIERNEFDGFVKLMVDYEPFFDADFGQLVVGHARLNVEVEQQINKDAVTLRLHNIPVKRTSIETYRPIALRVEADEHGYSFWMPYEVLETHVFTGYITWFRAFFEHHVKGGQPHMIVDQSPVEYNRFDVTRPDGDSFYVIKPPGQDNRFVWRCRVTDHTDSLHDTFQFRERMFLL